MVLESTIVCVDNSEYMRNGDYMPTRLQAQQDAVNLICMSKTRANPENNVGLVTFNNGRVVVTLTSEVPKILANLHQMQLHGMINFETGIRVAHLALKHRQGRNHKMRIVAFVGSPVVEDEKELIRIAKRLKKEKVNVDLVVFGQEQGDSTDKLAAFISTLNGKDGTGSHLVTIPPGPQLVEALVSSPVIQGEDGAGGMGAQAGFEFGMDPNDDPELALALRVSMEEQRARQEAEQRQPGAAAADPATAAGSGADAANVFASVAQEGAVSSGAGSSGMDTGHPLAAMTEEEQLAYAMQMSLNELDDQKLAEPMDTSEHSDSDEKKP